LLKQYGSVAVWSRNARLLATLLSLFALGGAPAAAAPPARIASMNLCTDSMLFELAEPQRIVSVTALSRDPDVSYFADRATTIAVNHGLAEEMIALQPDLILAGSYTAAGSNALLERLGFRVMTFSPALSLEEFRGSFRRLATALGMREKAEALLADMDSRIAAAKRSPPSTGDPRRAIIYRPNGFSPGYHSLANDMLLAAGFENLAERFDITYGGFVPLERLIVATPDVVLSDRPSARSPALADLVLDHPALRPAGAGGTKPDIRQFVIAEKFWTCGGTFIAEAVEQLAVLARR